MWVVLVCSPENGDVRAVCCWIAEMPLSDSQVRALKAGERRHSKSVGDSLILVIEAVARGGGKSFEGRMRFPPGRAGKQDPVRIGPYDKGRGKWTLKEAREEWDRNRAWSKQTGLDPRDLKCQEPQASIQQHAGPTVEQAAESFLDRSDTRDDLSTRLTVLTLNCWQNPEATSRVLMLQDVSAVVEECEDDLGTYARLDA